MVVGFCLRAPLSLNYPKVNSPATLCQFKNVPEIPLPTPKTIVLYENADNSRRITQAAWQAPGCSLAGTAIFCAGGVQGLAPPLVSRGASKNSGFRQPTSQPGEGKESTDIDLPSVLHLKILSQNPTRARSQ